MIKFKKITFIVFVALYSIGVCVGCIRQTRTDNQRDMYEYLESAVSGYNVPIGESIKSILENNLKLMAFLVAGGLFLVGPIILAGVMLSKGYAAGFAITSILRLFGMRGLLFCIANLVSVAIIIPAISWYSCVSLVNILNNRNDRKEFLKRFFLLFAIMIPVVLVDGVVRGFLSAILMNFASNV